MREAEARKEQQNRSRTRDEKKTPMKRGRIRTNIGTQEVAQVIDPATRYPELSARLKDVEEALHRMNRELSSVQKSSNIALG